MAQKNINLRILRSILLPAPPLDLQNEFAARIADFQSIITEQDRMADASDRLVNSLMHEMFGG